MARSPRGVLVEGADCSGKSSLVKRLKAELSGGWDVLQMGHKSGDQFRRYFGVYVDAQRLLLDRGHFSEGVYGDLWRERRHFMPWERSLLDDLARREFVTVLCTAPPALLWERYKARNAAAARREPAYVLSGGAAQPSTSLNDVTQAHARFVETVGSHATAIYESDRVESLEQTIRVILRSLTSPGMRTVASVTAGEPVTADFIVVEGECQLRSRVAQMLGELLPSWAVTMPARDPGADPFRTFLATYTTARHVIFDGGHLTVAASASSPLGGNLPTNEEMVHLSHYCASRGIIVVCEGATEPGDTSRRILGDAHVAFRAIRADDVSSVENIAASAEGAAAVRSDSSRLPLSVEQS